MSIGATSVSLLVFYTSDMHLVKDQNFLLFESLKKEGLLENKDFRQCKISSYKFIKDLENYTSD